MHERKETKKKSLKTKYCSIIKTSGSSLELQQIKGTAVSRKVFREIAGLTPFLSTAGSTDIDNWVRWNQKKKKDLEAP